MQLTTIEETVYNTILDSSEDQFVTAILSMSNDEYDDLIIFVRKFKILGMPLPKYLQNIQENEVALAQKTKEYLKKKTKASLHLLNDIEFKTLTLLAFRYIVQYF